MIALERYKLATASSTKHRSLIGTEMKISVSKSLDQADVESFVFDGGVENLEFDISTESKNNTNLYFAATGHGCASVEVCNNLSRGYSRLNFVILRSKWGIGLKKRQRITLIPTEYPMTKLIFFHTSANLKV